MSRKIKAEVLPLGDRKYYGTMVRIKVNGTKIVFPVWFSDERHPSNRQIRAWGKPPKDEMFADYMCDDHYETAQSYQIAKQICYAINNSGETA